MNYGNRFSQSSAWHPQVQIRRSTVFGSLIVIALVAFEIFNFSTTEFSLRDILGNLSFSGILWATILAIAFCGIDFAGLARMFTPEEGADEPREVWYLFGAWMLAAIMNAMLTWWGVSIAIYHDNTLGNGIIARKTLLQVVPVFVAVMVWLIRVLIIGTFATTGERLFGSQDAVTHSRRNSQTRSWQTSRSQPMPARSLTSRSAYSKAYATKPSTDGLPRPNMINQPTISNLNSTYRPAPRSVPEKAPESEPDYDNAYTQPDLNYVPVSMSSRKKSTNTSVRM